MALAKRIETSERELMKLLLRSSLLPSELVARMADVERGSLEPSALVVGAVPRDEASRRRALVTLRELVASLAALEAQRRQLRARVMSGPKRDASGAGLGRERHAVWRQMVDVTAGTRLASGLMLRTSEALLGLARSAAELAHTPASPALRAIEARAGLGYVALQQTAAAVEAATRRVAQARNDMAAAYQRLVLVVARKYQGRGLDLVDIVQEGNIGLMRAAEKYDHRQGYRFTTYATWWIRADLQRAISDQTRTIRLPSPIIAKLIRVGRARDALRRAGRVPSPEALAAEAGVSADELSRLMQLHNTVSIQSPLGEGGTTLEDSLSDAARPDVLEATEARELDEGLRRALAVLDPREARVLCARYGIGSDAERTLADLGREFGVSRERIRQIEVAALRRVRESDQAGSLRELLGL